MRTWAYPAVYEKVADDEWLVRFPDFPEAITAGKDLADAEASAQDALEETVLAYLAYGRPTPPPRAAGEGEVLVLLDPVTAARAVLAGEMRERKMTQRELAEKLGRTEGAVRRLVSGRADVKMDTVLQALRAIGVSAALSVPA